MPTEQDANGLARVVPSENYYYEREDSNVNCPNCGELSPLYHFAEGMPCRGCGEFLAMFVTTEGEDER